MVIGLSYNHPRPRWEINPCLSKRAPRAEVRCMGNQPLQLQELGASCVPPSGAQAEDRCIDKPSDFLYTSVGILRAAVSPM